MYLEDRKVQDTVNVPDQGSVKDSENGMELEHEHNCLAVVWCPNLDHGGVFDLSPWRTRLKAEILQKVLYTP